MDGCQLITDQLCSSHTEVAVWLFFMCPSFTDPRTLGYEETVVITLATVSVLAVLAVAAFFGYRMMHGELPWCHTVTKSVHYFGTRADLCVCSQEMESKAFTT